MREYDNRTLRKLLAAKVRALDSESEFYDSIREALKEDVAE